LLKVFAVILLTLALFTPLTVKLPNVAAALIVVAFAVLAALILIAPVAFVPVAVILATVTLPSVEEIFNVPSVAAFTEPPAATCAVLPFNVKLSSDLFALIVVTFATPLDEVIVIAPKLPVVVVIVFAVKFLEAFNLIVPVFPVPVVFIVVTIILFELEAILISPNFFAEIVLAVTVFAAFIDMLFNV